MATSSEHIRSWTGPTLLSYGFRPFFLGAAVWATVSMILWLLTLSGSVALPTRFDPVSWHAHEFLFGYVSATIAGFLLTAVPNWTGRMPIVGLPLAILFGLWLAGRAAIAFSAFFSPLLVALCDLSMLTVLALVIAREIIMGKNWRNLVVLLLLTVLIVGNGVFHWESLNGDYPASGLGLRIGLATTVMMIAIIGGRITPSFTRNWLAKRGNTDLPAPFAMFDRGALLILLGALLFWLVAPESRLAGLALLIAGLFHTVRLARWKGHKTGGEPLVWVLHAGYAFVPVGAMALGLAALGSSAAAMVPAAQHIWMAGGIGLMTLAVMTRATLGHTGRALHAGPATSCLYLLVIAAVAARLGAGLLSDLAHVLHLISGLLWIGAFGGFSLLYGPLLLSSRKAP